MKNIIFLFLLFAAGFTYSQDLGYSIKGKITNQDTGGNEGGVTITLKRNGSVVATTTSSSSGKYALNASGPQGDYEVVYSKAGMVTKKLAFSSNGLNVEDLPAGNDLPIPTLDIDLFSNRPNADFSFLDSEPVASFSWDNKKMVLDFDRVASEKTKKKINDLLLKTEKDAAQNEANYNKAIQEADALSDQKKYEEAVAKYEAALGFKPKEAYPAERIVDLEGLIQSQKQAALIEEQANSEYNNLIKAADNLRNSNDLAGAIAKYKEALTKKNEQYPKDQISALEAKLEQQKKEAENEAAYKVAIEKGDMFLKQNSLRAARDKYTEATNLKPSEQYPKDKLKEIEDKMKAQEEQELKKKKYEEAIAAADASFSDQDFTAAKTKYEEALTYEAAATYPKERIKLCNEEIAKMDAEKQKEEEIKRLLAEGTQALTAKQLDKAKSSFEGVLSLDAANAEAKDKLAQVEKLIQEAANQQAQEEKFNKLVTEGDAASTSKDFEKAVEKYKEALTLKTDTGVQQKLKNAENELAALKNAEAKKKQYDDAIAQADNLFSSESYEAAKSKYEEAISIDGTQQYPKDQLKKIADKLKEKELADNYQAIINEADQLFAAAKWENAKKKYQDALVLKPKESHPTSQIIAIDKELAKLAADKEREEKYNAAITKADQAYNSKKWQDAVNAYSEAITLASDPAYAQNRKEDAQSKLDEATSLAAKQKEFDQLISDSKTKIAQKDWENAKTKLEAALALFPENSEAQKMLNDVNSEIAKAKSAEEQEAEFARLKQEGMDLFAANNYQESKSKFNEALAIKEDQVIRKKLAEIQSILDQQAKDNVTQEKYDKLMAEALQAELQSNWQGALSKYREASTVKPDEEKPKGKIAALEAKLQSAQDQAKIDKEYNEIMQRGKQLMTEKKYLDAIKEFNNALVLKPNEQEPVDLAKEAERLERDKSTEVDAQYEKILTVAQTKIDERDLVKATELLDRARGLKPDDNRPVQMLEEIARLKQEEAKYQQVLSQASGFEAAKNYSAAKEKYLEASALKPNEAMPKEKAEEMQRILDDIAKSKESNELYSDYMTRGNTLLTQKDYQRALTSFQNALSAKPGDVPAQNKINEVQQILDDIANAENEENERLNRFNKLVSEADEMFHAEEYLPSVKKYEEALKIDPNSSYVKRQIQEAVRLEKEKGAIEAEREYRKIIEAGDKNFNIASYDKAKDYYNRALSLKSGDPYPKQKLQEIEDILNPKTVESVKLEDLGEPFPENSIMDGQALLRKAEEQRKLINGVKTKAELDSIAYAESNMTLEKTADHYENSNQIYMVQQKITQDAGESDLNRQATVETLKKSEVERQKNERENIHFEHSENLLDQEVLYAVDNAVALQYGEDISVYSDNADAMELFNRAQAERVSAEERKDKNSNINADQELTQVKLKVDQDTRDDYAERAEIREQVFNAESVVVETTTGKEDVNYSRLVKGQDEIDRVTAGYQVKFEEDARAVANNEEELKIVRKNSHDIETEHHVDKDIHLKKTDGEIRGVKLAVQEDSEGRDDARKSNVEIIKNGNKELADANYNVYNDELEKYVSNKATINKEVTKNNGIDEIAEEAMDKKIAYVEGVDKRARIDYEDDKRSDEQERLKARRGVETIYTTLEGTTADEADKLEENTVKLGAVSKTIDAKEHAYALGEQDKHYDAADVISGIDNAPKPKVRVANELGQEYPEGVSQESFTNKDQNGLMTAIITRRIVVIDGKADVYVRTQTLNGITYAKNGNPTLEHVWNKETQGPHLERHY